MSCSQKRKVGGRAAKLVKMAHSTARAARQDAEAVIRKAKFRLPATPDVVEPVLQSTVHFYNVNFFSVLNFTLMKSCAFERGAVVRGLITNVWVMFAVFCIVIGTDFLVCNEVLLVDNFCCVNSILSVGLYVKRY